MRRNPLQIRSLLLVFFLFHSFCGLGQVACIGRLGASSNTPCVGGSLYLFAHDTGLSANTTYSWSGPNNFSSNLKNPLINNFTSVGVGSYTLTATDTCTFVVTINVVLDTTPRPVISPSGPIWICLGDTLTLNTGNYPGSTYQWYLGTSPVGGYTSSSLTILSVSNFVIGPWTVKRNSATCASYSDSVVVTLSPSISITPNGPTSFCTGGSVTLQANVPCCNVSAQWQKNGVDIPGATGASYVATTTGSYTIKITRPNCSGSVTSAAVNVTAYAIPTPGINPPSPISVCQGNSVVLNATNVSGLNSYSWYANGNLYPAFSDTCSVSNAGVYWVKVTDNHGCSGTSPSVTVNVSPTPSVPVISQGCLVWACGGTNVTLSTNYIPGVSDEWYFNGIPIPSFVGAAYTIVGVTNIDVGIWTVKAINTYGCSSTSAPTQLSLYPNAEIVSSGPDTFCAGDSVLLSANITCCSVSYQWEKAPTQYGNFTNIAGANNINYVAHDSAFYQVAVTSSLCGTVTSAPQKVTVNPVPNPILVPSGSTVICPGDTVWLHTTNFTGIYEWYKNGSIFVPAPASGANLWVNSPGIYSVRVWNANAPACAAFSANDTVSFLPAPSVNIGVTQGFTWGLLPGHVALYPGVPIVFNTNLSGGIPPVSLQWIRNGVIIPGAIDTVYTDTTTGIFSVKATDSNGCSATSSAEVDSLMPCQYPYPYAQMNYWTLNYPLCPGSNQWVSALLPIYSGIVAHWAYSSNANPPYTFFNNYTFGGSTTSIVGNFDTLRFRVPTSTIYITLFIECLNFPGSSTHYGALSIHPVSIPYYDHVTSYGPDTFCVGGCDTLLSQYHSPSYQYQWQKNGVNIVGATDSFYFAQTSGDYTVRISYQGCTDTFDYPLSLMTKPVPLILGIATNSPACTGDSIGISSLINLSGVQFSWSGPNNFSDTGQNLSVENIQVPDSGEYVLAVTKDGCSAKDSIAVVVKQRPSVPSANTNGPICVNDSLLLYANDSAAGVSYEWSGGNNFSDTLQNTFIVSAQHADSGLYMVRALQNGCYSAYDTVNAVVNEWVMPVVSISSNPSPVVAGQSVVFTASGVNGGPSPSYQWYLNSVAIQGAVDSMYTGMLNAGDWISVTMHSDALCAYVANVLSNDIFVGTSLNVMNVGNVENVSVWPNPVVRVLNIDCAEQVNVELRSIEGRVLLREEHAKRIDISGLADGVYLLQVYDERGVLLKVEKVVKE